MAINRSTQQRQNYGLGSFVKKTVNKVTRPFTKVAQKLMPKELAGVARMAAPFLPPGYREAAYFAGTAKQKGKVGPLDLAFMAAPYARFSRAPTGGSGIFNTNTNFRFGKAGMDQFGKATDYGIRDLITGGERGGYFENIGGKGLLGKIPGDTDYGLKTDEFLFGRPEIDPIIEGSSETSFGNQLDEFKDAPGQAQGRIRDIGYNIPGKDPTAGILGKGGEMSTFFGAGDSPQILESKLGKLAFGEKAGPNELAKMSKIKVGSWGLAFVTKVKEQKFLDQAEAAEAAEAALLAENAQASDQDILDAKEWAISVFGRLSRADIGLAQGGRVNYAIGSDDKIPAELEDELLALSGFREPQDLDNIKKYMSDGPVLPPDPTQPVNPFGPKPIGPVLPNKEMAAIDVKLLPMYNQAIDSGEIGEEISYEMFKEQILKLMADKNQSGQQMAAQGGLMRNNYALGTKPEPKESGLGGLPIEADMRYSGGFMPYGKKEKADDVPARLSKNEFVFTADAVKAAGGGSMNEGARKMYQTMKMLEQQNRMMS